MKTTEIFVEQVLIGLLVLATGYLPYCNTGKIKELFASKSIVEGAGIVAIAYLLGIVFDRFADTLLSRLEQYHRLKFAFNLIKKGKQHTGSDPYPEDLLKIKILKGDKEPNEYEHYLRIRIRLSRALAVFTPALTISALLSLLQSKYDDINILFILSMTGLIYLICFFIILTFSKLSKTYEIYISFYKGEFVPPYKIVDLCNAIWAKNKDDHKLPEYKDSYPEKKCLEWLNKLLKEPGLCDVLHGGRSINEESITKLFNETEAYRNKKFFGLKDDEQYKIKSLNRLLLENIYSEKTPKCFSFCPDQKPPKCFSWYSWCWRDPTIIAAFILSGVAVSVAVYHPYKGYPWVIIPTGSAISAISFLSWYRISDTFMKFLMDCCNGDREIRV